MPPLAQKAAEWRTMQKRKIGSILPLLMICATNLWAAEPVALVPENNPQLVLAQTRVPELRVELKYATADNFTGVVIYSPEQRCYLHEETARALAAAQAELSRRHPGYRLIAYDCARPQRAQKRLFDAVKNTPRGRYVANPYKGEPSRHCRGLAIDLSILDENGHPLDMGTAYDFLGPLAEPRLEAQFLAGKRLTPAQADNRRLLREVMNKAGFAQLPTEWWHFNLRPKQAPSRYPLIP